MIQRRFSMWRRIGQRRPHRAVPLLLAVLATGLTMVPGPASGQAASLGVAVAPLFDSPVTVGEQNQPALLRLTNGSAGAAAGETITLTNIRLNRAPPATPP